MHPFLSFSGLAVPRQSSHTDPASAFATCLSLLIRYIRVASHLSPATQPAHTPRGAGSSSSSSSSSYSRTCGAGASVCHSSSGRSFHPDSTYGSCSSTHSPHGTELACLNISSRDFADRSTHTNSSSTPSDNNLTSSTDGSGCSLGNDFAKSLLVSERKRALKFARVAGPHTCNGSLLHSHSHISRGFRKRYSTHTAAENSPGSQYMQAGITPLPSSPIIGDNASYYSTCSGINSSRSSSYSNRKMIVTSSIGSPHSHLGSAISTISSSTDHSSSSIKADATSHNCKDDGLPASTAEQPHDNSSASQQQQHDVHHAKLLMSEIKSCKTVEELAILVNTTSHQLNTLHLTAAVTHLQQLVSKGGLPAKAKKALERNAREVLRVIMEKLLQPSHLQSCDPRGIMNVLHSLAVMKIKQHEYIQGLVDELARDDYKKLKEADTTRLGTIVWALARITNMGYQAPRDFWRVAGDILVDVYTHERTRPATLSSVMYGLALAGYYHPSLLARAECAIALEGCLDDGESQHWSTTLWAFSQLQFPLQQSTLDYYAQKILGGCLEYGTAQSWSNALAAFAAYKYLDPVVCDMCAEAIISRIWDDVQSQHIASVLHSWAVLHCPQPASLLLDLLAQNTYSRNLLGLVKHMKPNDLCSMLWALSALNMLGTHQQLVEQLVKRVNVLDRRDVPRDHKVQSAWAHWAMQCQFGHDTIDRNLTATAGVNVANAEPRDSLLGAVDASLHDKNDAAISATDTQSQDPPAQKTSAADSGHGKTLTLNPALVQAGILLLKEQHSSSSGAAHDIAEQLKVMQACGAHGVTAVHVDYRVPALDGAVTADVLVELDGQRKVAIIVRNPHEFMMNVPDHLDGRARLRERLLQCVFGFGNVVSVYQPWDSKATDEVFKQATLARLLFDR